MIFFWVFVRFSSSSSGLALVTIRGLAVFSRRVARDTLFRAPELWTEDRTMTRKHIGISLGLLLLTAMAAWIAIPAQAANPLATLFKKVEADPKKSYTVSQTNGPWMVMVTVCRGKNAMEQAQALVLELRKSQQLLAYTHEKVSDYTQSWEGNHFSRDGQPDRWKYVHGDKIREVAVLVGDFGSFEDPNAAKVLKQIKEFVPQTKLGSEDAGSDSLVMIENFRKARDTKYKRGPLAGAFLCTNPLLPKEYFQNATLSKVVVEMNSQADHSLLTCPGKYSVKVATFSGSTLIDQKKIKQVSKGAKLQSKLYEAGIKAHALADHLRSKGIEAYEFHDEHESIVCVGSFDFVAGPKQDDGKQQINPAVHRVMEEYKPKPEANTTGLHPKRFELVSDGDVLKVSCDLQPIPVQVPKQTVSGVYQR